ncbi:hypothetical protein SAMN05216207_101644 [Pseudonocardia ammonioxydans]|uniref:SHOCT domain-containing protein n=2 Tax=Pseudonocardia ammonioxydans TaxID=260086 RepID=A0A1I4ZWE8_PSUAM|nr:hypothetical protein SAMN05216207_101644 [Pseudonocardia ammonioxydans]
MARGVGTVVEVVGRTVDVIVGFGGVRSRGANARARKRRDAGLEELTRLHASGRIGTQEFQHRKRRLPG